MGLKTHGQTFGESLERQHVHRWQDSTAVLFQPKAASAVLFAILGSREGIAGSHVFSFPVVYDANLLILKNGLFEGLESWNLQPSIAKSGEF